MSEEQVRRVGLNESIFRQVNEQIESLNRDFGTDDRTMTVICECAHGELHRPARDRGLQV